MTIYDYITYYSHMLICIYIYIIYPYDWWLIQPPNPRPLLPNVPVVPVVHQVLLIRSFQGRPNLLQGIGQTLSLLAQNDGRKRQT